METPISSLKGVFIDVARRSGNTTRAIDNAIQIIFSGIPCKIEDPWAEGININCNRNMFQRTLDRLSREHFIEDRLDIDRQKLIISLKD